MPVKIGIDPGHGGWDTGATGYGLQEKEINLDVSLKLKALLDKDNRFEPIITRTSDTYLSLRERTNLLNNSGAKVSVSIHHNAGGSDGTAVLCTVGNYPDSVRFANILLEKFIENCKMSTWLDGIYRRYYPANQGLDYYHMIRETTMPTVIGENGFVDDKQDAEKMKTQQFRIEEAGAYYEALCTFFGYKPHSGKIDTDEKVKGTTTKPSKDNLILEGDRGPKVKRWQKKLKALGYYHGNIDSIFGPKTKRAVVEFQHEESIQVDGIIGPVTKKHLKNAEVKPEPTSKAVIPYPEHIFEVKDPMIHNDDVRSIQRALNNAVGFEMLTVDGWYGLKTAAVVRDYQRRHGLTIDGIVGPNTWNTLF